MARHKREKKVVKVIGISPVPKREVTIRTGGYLGEYTDSIKHSIEGTLVLYTVDGELKTQFFDGKWSLDQVSHWNFEEE